MSKKRPRRISLERRIENIIRREYPKFLSPILIKTVCKIVRSKNHAKKQS